MTEAQVRTAIHAHPAYDHFTPSELEDMIQDKLKEKVKQPPLTEEDIKRIVSLHPDYDGLHNGDLEDIIRDWNEDEDNWLNSKPREYNPTPREQQLQRKQLLQQITELDGQNKDYPF